MSTTAFELALKMAKQINKTKTAKKVTDKSTGTANKAVPAVSLPVNKNKPVKLPPLMTEIEQRGRKQAIDKGTQKEIKLPTRANSSPKTGVPPYKKTKLGVQTAKQTIEQTINRQNINDKKKGLVMTNREAQVRKASAENAKRNANNPQWYANLYTTKELLKMETEARKKITNRYPGVSGRVDYEARANMFKKARELRTAADDKQKAEYYSNLKFNADYGEKSVYVPKVEKTYANGNVSKNTDVKKYQNSNKFTKGGLGEELNSTDNSAKYWINRMTDEEINNYNYIYNTQGKDSAEDYLKFLERDLNKRQAEYEKGVQRKYAKEHPADATAATIFSVAPRAAGGIVETAAQNMENKRTGRTDSIDVNSNAFALERMKEDNTKAVTENMGDTGKFLYNTGVSMGENLVNLPFGGTVTLATLAGSAFSQTVYDATKRGATADQAARLGLASAVIEVATEKIGIDRLFKVAKSGEIKSLKELLISASKQGGIEGAEEFISEIANAVMDNAIMGDKSNYQLGTKNYMSQGASEKYAKKLAMLDVAKNAGLSFLGGAVSGGIMGGGAALINSRIKSPVLPSTEVKTPPSNSNADTKYSQSNHTPEQLKVMQEYENAVDDDLLSFIQRAKDNPKDNKSTFEIGDVSHRLAEDVNRLTGINIDDYTHAIKSNSITHIENGHGKNGTTDNSMADDNDIARMKYVIDNYDNIELLDDTSKEFRDKNQKPTPLIKMSKRIDGTYYVVEAVPDTKKHQLNVVTAYKNKAVEQQTGAAQDHNPDVRNASADTAFDNNIPQNDSVVNNQYMQGGENNSKGFPHTLTAEQNEAYNEAMTNLINIANDMGIDLSHAFDGVNAMNLTVEDVANISESLKKVFSGNTQVQPYLTALDNISGLNNFADNADNYTYESGDLKEELRKRWENRLKTEGLKPSENVTPEHAERYTDAVNNLLEIAKSKNLDIDTFYKEIEGKVDPDNLTYDGVKWTTIAMGNLFKGHLDENISRYIEMMHDAEPESSSEYTPYSELSDDKQAEFTQRINELNDKYTDLTPEEGEELAERLYEKFGKEKGRYIEPVNDISAPIYGEHQQDALSELVSTLVGNNGYVFELRKNAKSVERAYSPTEKQMQYIEKIARGEADISDFSKDVGLDKLQPVIDAYKELYKAENDGIKGYRERTLNEYRTKVRNFLKNSNKWKDKLFGLQWYINTPERNAQDTMGEDAEAFINEFITPMKKNTAQGERYKTALVEKINSLNLSKEDFELVMKYGEGIYSEKNIPGVKLEMVKNAAKVFNEISEKIKDDVNASLVLNGYNPIDNPKIHLNSKETRIAMRALNGRISGNSIENQKIKQFINIAKRYGVDSIETDQRGRVFATVNIPYFPHGQIDDGVSALKKKLGLSDDVSELPGEITGRTEQFKPNKKWSGNLEHRNGQKTSYDIRNWRGYINDMAEIIYHTSDISKLRTLESELRNKYSENGEYFDSESTGAESLVGYDDLDKHNNLINWISEYANQMAGKKSSLDRGFERLVGRRIYNLVNTIQKNWSVNMIGGNISSAINQFSQMTNLISECNPLDILTATVDIATSNLEQARNDSSFLTSKKGTPILGMTTADKISEGMFYLTGKTENFTSMLVFQTKYNEMKRKRLSHQEAVGIADKYTAAVMADRTKAGLPVIFNSRNPIVKLFTTFQVEALNNLQHTFKDLPREARESKCFLWLVKCILAQWFAKYLFNKGKEKLTGSGSSEFEPITLGVTAYKAIAQKDGVTAEDVQEVLGNTTANLPGMQTVMALAGFDNAGQIPMSNMVPNIPELAGKIKEGDASYIEDMGDTVINAANPFGGYGQAKKTVKGLKAVIDGGVYTKGGNLKYPVEQTPGNFVKGALFGKSALPETKEYYNQKDRPKLSESEMEEYNYRTSNGEDRQAVYDDLLQRKAESKKEAERNSEYMEAAKEGINELDYGMKYEVENIYKRYKQIDPSATGIGCPQAEKIFSYNKEKYPLSPEEFAELQSRYNANYSFFAKPVLNNTELSDKEKYERLKNIRKKVRDTVNEQFYDEHYNTHGKSSYEILKGMANERRGKLPKAQNSETYQNNVTQTEQQSEAMNKLRQMIESDDAKRAGKTSLNYGNYKVTNNFGEYSNSHQAAHKGMDFAFDYGTPVQSPVSGRVVDIKSLNGSYGKYVVVEDNNGNYHYFAHLSGFNCEVGQQVGRGQTIAYSGNSGNSTGPHLHYEVRQGNDYNAQIDPRNYL